MSRCVQHPFGRENEVSVKQLHSSFCNHVYLGQWELAEACTRELYEQRDLDQGNVCSLLEDIVSNPYDRSIGAANKSIQSPHHMSWMSLEAVQKIVGKESGLAREEVEFRLILLESKVPPEITKELYVFYTRSLCDGSPASLSEVCMEALDHLMLDNPTIGHIMIQKLTSACRNRDQNIALYEVYINTIQKSLHNSYTVNLYDASSSEQTRKTELCEEDSSYPAYHILSLFDARECYVQSLKDKLAHLFYMIIDTITTSSSVLRFEPVYSALLGRDSAALLQLFLTSLRDYKRKDITSHSQLDLDTTELETYLLRVCQLDKREQIWEELFLSTLPNSQHFLDVILGLGIKLVKSSQFPQLKKLLGISDFIRLKPLLMLIGWDHCRSVQQGYELVEALQDHRTETLLLHKPCTRLKLKAVKLLYFLQMIKEILPEHCPRIEALLKCHHFSGLSLYSPLYMLHNSVSLSQMPEERVMRLLTQEGSVTTEQSADSLVEVSIYQGFCAIKSFLTALLNSASMKSWVTHSAESSLLCDRETRSDITDRGSRTCSPQEAEINRAVSCAPSLDLEDLQARYCEKVLEYLEHVKDVTARLQPLQYKMEILENLFSLLFVRLEAISDENEGNEEIVETGNEGDHHDNQSTPPQDDTPVPGTPVTPSTPVYLTPCKVLDQHNIGGGGVGFGITSTAGNGGLEKAMRNLNQDLFLKVMSDLSELKDKQQEQLDQLWEDHNVQQGGDSSNNNNSGPESVRQRKDPRIMKDVTDNSSAASKGSSLGLGHLGFIANEYFVRDALFTLKSCVEQISSQLSGCEELVTGYEGLKCSIAKGAVKQHAVRLTQYISEGLWRLQLVSHRTVPFEYGKVLAEMSRLDCDSSDDEPNWTDDEQTSTITLQKRRRKWTSIDQSGTESHVTTEGSQSNPSPSSRKSLHLRRQRSKRARVRGLLERNQGVISHLLSDRNSLLVMCLRKGKLSQASQVVKLFGLEQTLEDAEVLFADHFQAAVEKVQSHDSKVAKHMLYEHETSHPRHRADTKLSLSSKSLMGNIASKAAKGASSMTVSNTAEQLLGLTIQPALHHCKDITLVKPPLSQHVSEDLVPTMIVLDLACSSSTTWESSGVLLDVATRRLPSHLKQGIVGSRGHDREPLAPSKKALQLQGIVGMLEAFSSLVQSCSSRPTVGSSSLPHCTGVNACLNTGVSPLDAELCTVLHFAQTELESALKKTQAALKSVTDTSTDNKGEKRQKGGHRGKVRRDQDAKKSSLRFAFNNLVTQCSKASLKNGLMQYVYKEAVEVEYSYMYLQSCYDYFKTLSTLLAEYEGKNRETIAQLEYFALLNESPTETLGKTLFLHKADPYRLQQVTESLHIDLVQVILHNTCPLVTSVPLQDMSTQSEDGDSSHRDCLNSGPVYYSSRLVKQQDDPVRLLETLLSSWIQLLRGDLLISGLDDNSEKGSRCVLRVSDLRSLSKTTACQTNACNSRLLQEVDLSLLKNDAERLCLFLNLYHCMLLHALLHFVGKEDFSSVSSLLGHHSDVEQIFVEKSLTYVVGQMGRISLYDLRYVILNPGDKEKHGRLLRQLSVVQDIDRYDPWSLYSPAHDGLLRRVVTNQSFAYYFQVYYPDLVDFQLGIAEKDLLMYGQAVEHSGILLSRDTWLHTIKLGLGLPNTVEYYNVVLDHVPVQNFLKQGKPLNATYKLSPSVCNYLRYKSGLIATMAGLVSTEDTETSMTEDITRPHNGSSSTTTTSPQIKSDFPVLHRHLQTQAMHLVSGSDDHKMSSVPDQLWHILTKDLSSQLKVMLLSSSQTAQFQQLLRDIFIELIRDSHKWKQLADLCIDCPLVSRLQNTDWNLLKTIALLTCIASIKLLDLSEVSQKQSISDLVNSDSSDCDASSKKDIKELLWNLTCAITDKELGVRTLLSCLNMLTSQVSLRYLRTALLWLPESHGLRVTVVQKIKEMDVYQRIESCAQLELQRLPSNVGVASLSKSSANVHYYTPQEEDPGLNIEDKPDNPIHSRDFLESLLSWPQIYATSVESSDLVLEFLLKCDQYSLARDWVHVFGFVDFSIIIDESCIVYHLEQKEPNIRQVIEILEQMRRQNPQECTKVCMNVVDRLMNKKYTASLITFVRQNLSDTLSEDEFRRLCVCHLGCQALLCLPNHMQPDYDHLMALPLVLMEQLLMNMKVDLSSKVLACLKAELRLLQEAGVDLESLEFDIRDTDGVLVEYASKALEFSVVQSDSLSSGRASVLSHTSAGGGSLMMSGGGGGTPTTSLQLPRKLSMVMESGYSLSPASRRLSMGTNLGSTAPSMRKMSRVDSGGQLSRLRYTGGSVPSNLDKKAIMSSSYGAIPEVKDTPKKVFVMPAEPPAKDQWVPDSATIVCMLCRVERFSMFNRRHHCRRCGRVVCSTCSSKTLTIRGASARACDDCYRQSHQPKEVLSNKEKADRLRQKLSAGGMENNGPGIQITVGSPIPDEEMMSPPLYGEYKYFLSQDPDMNDLAREEFYYDHAPSSSLCLSILDLHSDSTQCSQVILDLCDKVSTYLHTSETGLKNPEVDYGLVIKMLKHLLFHAKMKCVRAGDTATVSKCDLYLDRVHLLDQMVASNISYIPSIERLTRIEVLRQLRDKFLSEERWTLSMELSTKCGIDPSGVWLAWGKSCLRMGDYASGREKLAKCLKIPGDKQSSQTSKMLTDVIECIEHSTTSLAGGDLISQLKSIKDLLAEPQRRAENLLEEARVQECIHYLKTYGTYGSLVSYFQKHSLYIKALQLIVAETCPTEILIDCLVMPSLHCGELSQLFEAMKTLDSSLSRFDTHLTVLCRYLNKNGLLHTLYQLQLFMKDYIRAAMTCVTHFYQKEAAHYLDLHRRINFLSDAKEHLESYLEQKMWTTSLEGSGKKGSEDSSRLVMTPREVTKYIHTIDLQLEVTKYLNHYQENLGIVLLFTGDKPPPPPPSPTRPHGAHKTHSPDLFIRPGQLTTLFGSTRMKSEVVALVLLTGNNINDGFGLGFRIIQDLKLDSMSIYSLVGTTLARQHKYSFIQQLLSCMKDSGLCTDLSFDDVIISCVEVMTRDPDQLQEAESFIKLLRSDVNKINMYMKCGKLKSAYLLAVKTQRVEVIQRIEQDAVRLNQPAVRSICQKWLKQHGH